MPVCCLLKSLLLCGVEQDAPQFYRGSEFLHRMKMQTAVHLIELVDAEDQRASQCPAGQRLLRVAGARDQVGRWTLFACA